MTLPSGMSTEFGAKTGIGRLDPTATFIISILRSDGNARLKGLSLRLPKVGVEPTWGWRSVSPVARSE
jgi:hypothetical protein